MEENDTATVMVVDDEERMAKCYKLFIQDTYDAFIAIGGQAAVDKLTREVDVVLLDRRMPEMHGHEVLEHISQGDYNCRVIIISALDPDMDIIEYDFSKYLTKPVVKEELLNAIEQVRMLDRYENLLTEYYQTVEKFSIMKSEFDTFTLEESEEFQAIKQNISQTQEEIDDVLSVFNSTTESVLRGDELEEVSTE
jgi:DNA-binding response OmpR family regulator